MSEYAQKDVSSGFVYKIRFADDCQLVSKMAPPKESEDFLTAASLVMHKLKLGIYMNEKKEQQKNAIEALYRKCMKQQCVKWAFHAKQRINAEKKIEDDWIRNAVLVIQFCNSIKAIDRVKSEKRKYSEKHASKHHQLASSARRIFSIWIWQPASKTKFAFVRQYLSVFSACKKETKQQSWLHRVFGVLWVLCTCLYTVYKRYVQINFVSTVSAAIVDSF